MDNITTVPYLLAGFPVLLFLHSVFSRNSVSAHAIPVTVRLKYATASLHSYGRRSLFPSALLFGSVQVCLPSPEHIAGGV